MTFDIVTIWLTFWCSALLISFKKQYKYVFLIGKCDNYPIVNFLKNAPVFQTAYMPIKGKLFCFWCNFFVVFRFFLYVGLVKQLGDLKRKKTFLSLAKKRKCGFHPFFFEDLFNSLYEDTHFFSLRLSYLFNTPVVGWELSVKHKFCTYKESLRNFRDLLFRG